MKPTLKQAIEELHGFQVLEMQDSRPAKQALQAWWETYVDTDLSMRNPNVTVTTIPDPEEAYVELLALGEEDK